MIKILFICHGNICRSTMAESVMSHLIQTSNLQAQISVSSAATSREEIGNPPHHGTVSKLRQANIPVIPHQAVQMRRQDYKEYDYLIGMDSANIRNMLKILGGDPKKKVSKLLSFAGRGDDIADPWYTGNFDETFQDVLEGCQGLLQSIQKTKGISS